MNENKRRFVTLVVLFKGESFI